METPLIITARVNETAVDRANANFPYRPQEIVREAVRAWEAGASILHWHARVPGEPGIATDPALYHEVYEGVREWTDLLLQPGLGLIADPAGERIRHVAGVELVPVEFGSFDVDYWDPAARRFETGDRIYQLTREKIEAVLRALQGTGALVTASCWDFGHVRTARHFREMGLLPAPTLWELVFTGEVMPAGAPPTLTALHALVTALPDDEPWLALCWNGDALELAGWAATLGGHVGIGLGDHDYARFGTPHNGELVARVAALARSAGRDVATPAQAREILGLPAPAAVAR